MAKVLRVVATIAAVVAVVVPGLQEFAPALLSLSAGTAATIAAVAGIVAAVAGIAAQMLTKPPPARGATTQLLISPDAPAPYAIGEGYVGGVLRHDTAYGATLSKVPNPYRWMVAVYSIAGPVFSITPWVDMAPVSSWYAGFLYTGVQLGAVPEAHALTPQFAGAPGWSSSSKLSGKPAIGWNLKFDKDGKRFASGVPKIGAYGKWVKVYDPRKDSTFPGGSGAHRLGDESTYEWSENAALHAGTYAFGRYANGKMVFGIGLPQAAIDWRTVASWANVCQANSWKVFGVCWEGGTNDAASQRNQNLTDICVAGGGEPIFSGAVLSFKYAAPRVSLDTFTDADLVGDDGEVTAQASYRDRVNTILPKFVSPANDWQLVDGTPVAVPSLVAEDGEERKAEWPFNFVKDATQAAVLARYRIEDSRELQPITLTFGQRCRAFRAGECVHLKIDRIGLDTDAVIVKRSFDPSNLTVTFSFIGETPGKHAYALGQTTTPPPTPAIGQTAQERDELASAATEGDTSAVDALLIANSVPVDSTPLDGLFHATATTIAIEAHNRSYQDKTVAVNSGSLSAQDDGTAFVASTIYNIYYDDPTRAGGAVTYKATTDSNAARNSADHTARHYVGSIKTDATGGTGTTGGGAVPPGWQPGYYYRYPGI